MIFDRPHPDPRAERFLAEARRRAHTSTAVWEIAEAMNVGVSHLRRLTLAWFEFPPGVLIDLARVLSLVADLVGTSLPSSAIARAHGFLHRSALNRQVSSLPKFVLRLSDKSVE